MKAAGSIPADLARVARQVVWFAEPEVALARPRHFLAHVMTHGSPEHVAIAERYFAERDFRDALDHAPVGVFTREAWARWHRRFGVENPPPRPRRRLPGGVEAPLWEELAGRG